MYKLLESSNLPEDQQITFSLKENNDNEFVKLASLKDFPEEVDEAIKNYNNNDKLLEIKNEVINFMKKFN